MLTELHRKIYFELFLLQTNIMKAIIFPFHVITLPKQFHSSCVCERNIKAYVETV